MDHYVFSGLSKQHQTIVKSLMGTDVEDLIFQAIHKVLGVKPQQIKSPVRKREYCDARQMYFTLLRRATDRSLKDIGRSTNRHHSTVISSMKAHKRTMQYDEAYQHAYAELCSEISYLIDRKHVKEE